MQISKIDLHLLPKIGQKSEHYIPDKLFNQQPEGVLESKNIPLPLPNHFSCKRAQTGNFHSV